MVDNPSPKSKRRILIAEDEANLRSLLRLSLGQCYDVEAVVDGVEAVKVFGTFQPELLILDVMMPRMDGFQVCEEIRRISEVPIIMLTALGSIEDLVKGFGLGADDYITKPFVFKELMARVEAVFRRVDWILQPPPARIILNGELRIDTDSHQVWYDNAEIHLTPVEFQLLQYLATRPGQTVSKEALFREVWGYDLAGGTNLVEVGVRRLHEKINAIRLDPS